MEPDLVIRAATPDDAAGLAALKLLWSPPADEPDDAARARYTEDLRAWLSADEDHRSCVVAESGTALVGMAWLVMFERAPDFDARQRLTGDVQSVFVHPEFRGHGIGGRLVDTLVTVADERGAARVTVSANAAAASLYKRAGFAATPSLLDRRS